MPKHVKPTIINAKFDLSIVTKTIHATAHIIAACLHSLTWPFKEAGWETNSFVVKKSATTRKDNAAVNVI